MNELRPHRDRLLPAEPATRALARALYDEVADAPILSAHGHVSARLLADNAPFDNPADLLVTPDHYVTRLLHAHGVGLTELGVATPNADPRHTWRVFCTHWPIFRGTPVRFWLADQLSTMFGIDVQPSAGTADELYDSIATTLAAPAFRPQALLDRFDIEVLATTDDPADDLAAHRSLAGTDSLRCRVIPTMRSDAYLDPTRPGWAASLDRLERASGEQCHTYKGLLAAMRIRRAHFAEHGATATDCGPRDAWAVQLTPAEAQRLHAEGLAGTITVAGATAYRRDLVYQFAAMAAEDGLVMQLHPGVIRNHHRPTFDRFGPDTGHDLPTITEFTEPLRAVLDDFGTDPNFRVVLFTVDETAFARDIAPLAGFYPSVYAGAPWWFLDAPDAIRRYRSTVTETAGFAKTSGFIDDTRALCSIPARHDMSRRVDAGYLAELVVTHRLDEDDAFAIARDLVDRIPRATFRLPPRPAGS